MSRTLCLLFLLILPSASAPAQNACPAVPSITASGTTIFTPEQENYIGDVVVEILQRSLPVYRQSGLTDPLERIATRLLRYLPPNDYKFHFELVEIPSATAMAVPGGRIFVSRRLIAFVESEHELAGVIAHEMGHVLSRQASIELSRGFRDVLKVTAVSDREDVFRRMNQLMDSPSMRTSTRRLDDDQIEADRISLAATSRAGYDPEALPRFFDRLTGNQGNTGNFLRDVFGLTRPESRRYREMLREIRTLPASCRETRPAAETEAFYSWKTHVSELSPEDLLQSHGDRKPALQLTPKLPPDIHNIKFSPDGKVLLAQDNSGISVLQTAPLGLLFRIPALGARKAIFHKDGNRIIFQSSNGRVEVWNFRSRTRERRLEPYLIPACEEMVLSPDGRTAACMNDTGGMIRLVELDTGAEIVRKEFVPEQMAFLAAILLNQPLSYAAFSPDGSSFLTANRSRSVNPWAFDLDTRRDISIGNPLRGALHASFAFLTSDQIAAVHGGDENRSGVFTWPEGKQIDQFSIPDFPLTAATKGSVIFLRPMGPFAVGAISIEKRAIFQVSTNAALDRYDDIGAAERNNGEIALYRGTSTQPAATIALPESPLGALRSAAHSPDLEWLALSVRGRSVLWNLRNTQVTLLPPFDNAFMSADGLLGGTFEIPAQDSQGRPAGTARMRQILDLRKRAQVSSTRVPDRTQEAARTMYAGRYEITMITSPRGSETTRLQVKDSVEGRALWQHEFEAVPYLHVANAVVLQYRATDKAADKIIKASADLKRQFDMLSKRQNDVLFKVLALETGKELGHVLVELADGEFVIRKVYLAGRNLFVEDSNSRTLAYSLDVGGRAGQQFGRVLAMDIARGHVAIEKQMGSVVVFDGSMRSVAEFNYPGNLVYAGFDGTGSRFLAVTGEQQIFIETLPEQGKRE